MVNNMQQILLREVEHGDIMFQLEQIYIMKRKTV